MKMNYEMEENNMSQIISEDNIYEYRKNLEGNFHNSIKSSILNFIENDFSYLLKSNKFTEDMLDDITTKITDDEQLNDYLDGLMIDEIQNYIKENELGDEEKEI